MKAKVKSFVEKHEGKIRNMKPVLVAVVGGLAGFGIGQAVGKHRRDESWTGFFNACCDEVPELDTMMRDSAKRAIEKAKR